MVLSVQLVPDVMSVFRGPRRKWKVMLRKSLTSKSRKTKFSSRSSSSSPWSTAPDSDLDSRFAAQFDSVNKVMDK